jgi:GT2 family glycosyltransferase
VTLLHSVIIPVRNRAALTRWCLETILSEPAATPFEVIVVDDGSRDGTAAVLREYGGKASVVRRAESGGFARACNDGAVAANGERLVFLNNDTRPEPGWLDALAGYADAHPEAAVAGARLVSPAGTIQHAGVVIGRDGYPHHLYSGFPRDHPCVTKSRRFQAVTAACALVRREAFDDADGFDARFRNSLEDVDLCLRLGQLGHEVHYCHRAVVCHLESASRGYRDRFAESVDLYRERWRDRVRRDDIDYYIEDGLLDLEYDDAYPLRLSLSPRLAVIDGGRGAESERMLDAHSRQVTELLREVGRLTAHVADLELGWAAADGPQGPSASRSHDAAEASNREEFLRRARQLELELAEIQSAVARGSGRSRRGRPEPDRPRFEISPYLEYRRVLKGVREAVERTVPPNATVLVASRGDPELLKLGTREVWHFPREPGGRYAGYYPADSVEAVSHLEHLRAHGAQYFVLPATAYWWRDAYRGFGEHLAARYRVANTDACSIFCLDAAPEPISGGRSG